MTDVRKTDGTNNTPINYPTLKEGAKDTSEFVTGPKKMHHNEYLGLLDDATQALKGKSTTKQQTGFLPKVTDDLIKKYSDRKLAAVTA